MVQYLIFLKHHHLYFQGFPDHPHRGFETVTYVLDGALEHEDFCGHQGIIRTGDLQWMTAGNIIL